MLNDFYARKLLFTLTRTRTFGRTTRSSGDEVQASRFKLAHINVRIASSFAVLRHVQGSTSSVNIISSCLSCFRAQKLHATNKFTTTRACGIHGIRWICYIAPSFAPVLIIALGSHPLYRGDQTQSPKTLMLCGPVETPEYSRV